MNVRGIHDSPAQMHAGAAEGGPRRAAGGASTGAGVGEHGGGPKQSGNAGRRGCWGRRGFLAGPGGRAFDAAFIALHGAVVAATLVAPAMMLAGALHQVQADPEGLARWVQEGWPRWRGLLLSSLRVSVPALIIAVGLGTLLATVLFKTDARGRRPALALLLLAAMFPLYVTGGAMLGVFRRQDWTGSNLLAGLVHGVAHLPLVALIVGVALRMVNAEYEEAALVEGAGRARMLLRVSLRLARGAVLAAMVLVVLWTWTDYSISDVLMVRTFAEEVYTQYALNLRPYESVLVTLPQFVLIGGLLWLFRKGLLRGDWAEPTYAETYRVRLGRWQGAVSASAVAVVAALVLAPIGSLAANVRKFSEVPLSLRLFAKEIQLSAATSLAAGAICATLAVGLAWLAVRRPVWRAMMGAYIAFMLAFPAPIMGIGLITLFNRDGPLGDVYMSPAMLVIAYIERFLPVAVILLVPAVRRVPIEHEHAARADGCGTAGVLAHVIWPACLPAALAAAFVVIVLSLGELPCSNLVSPPGHITVTTRFFGLIHYGLYADSAMLCLWSVAAIMIPWAGLLWLLRRHLP